MLKRKSALEIDQVLLYFIHLSRNAEVDPYMLLPGKLQGLLPYFRVGQARRLRNAFEVAVAKVYLDKFRPLKMLALLDFVMIYFTFVAYSFHWIIGQSLLVNVHRLVEIVV